VKPQSSTAHQAVDEHCDDSRDQIQQFLRLQKISAVVLLVAMALVCIISSGGLFAAVLKELQTPASLSESPTLIGFCLIGWIGCLHYLWRFYRTGLEGVRALLTQLSQIDETRAEFAIELREVRKLYRLAASRVNDTAVSKPLRGIKRKLKGSALRAQKDCVDATPIDNVLDFENYKNM